MAILLGIRAALDPDIAAAIATIFGDGWLRNWIGTLASLGAVIAALIALRQGRTTTRVALRQVDVAEQQTDLAREQTELAKRQIALAEQSRRDSIDPKIACFAEIPGRRASMLVKPGREVEARLTSPVFCLRNHGSGPLTDILHEQPP
ncbi:MAG: hypothetical protein RIB84_23820 [Sneathiellaceae bacterium]